MRDKYLLPELVGIAQRRKKAETFVLPGSDVASRSTFRRKRDNVAS